MTSFMKVRVKTMRVIELSIKLFIRRLSFFMSQERTACIHLSMLRTLSIYYSISSGTKYTVPVIPHSLSWLCETIVASRASHCTHIPPVSHSTLLCPHQRVPPSHRERHTVHPLSPTPPLSVHQHGIPVCPPQI